MHRTTIGLRALGAIALLTGAFAAASQPRPSAPRCYFMECEGDVPNPTPAAPTPITASLPAQIAPRGPDRPRAIGESCTDRQGFLYCASSVLAPQHGFSYLPANLLDARLDTAWVEGQANDGEGEWIAVDLRGARRLRRIELLNGYHKNAGLFSRNNRVRDLEIRMSSGRSVTVRLLDESGVQGIDFTGEQVSWVQLTITSVYRGTKYRDTAISELRVLAD